MKVKITPTPTPVIPKLFVCAESTVQEKELLLRMGVTHILSIGAGPPQGHHPGEFTHLRIGIKDAVQSDLLPILPQCLEFISEGVKQGSVVVHCKAGRSRSVSVVIAYLIKLNPSLTVSEALSQVRKSRAMAQPNPSFIDQLNSFRDSLQSSQNTNTNDTEE